MKNNKETRTCIGCRKKDNKHNLIRIVNLKKNGFVFDIDQKIQGRGAYICKNEECLNRALKNKSLKLNIDEESLKKIKRCNTWRITRKS